MNNVNSNNYFDVLSYIKDNLEEITETEDRVIVSLNEDNNKEPYIEITYIDTDGNVAGLTKNYDSLNLIDSYADYYSEVIDISGKDNVTTIVYDTATGKLNLINTKNGICIGNKLKEDFGTAIFVGYIVNPKLLMSYEEKLKKLYDVMKEIMCAAYDHNYESDFIFFVKEEEIGNVYTTKKWKGFESNSEEEIKLCDKNNLSVIESVFETKLEENQIQKCKK